MERWNKCFLGRCVSTRQCMEAVVECVSDGMDRDSVPAREKETAPSPKIHRLYTLGQAHTHIHSRTRARTH